jgi:hypothetical protein
VPYEHVENADTPAGVNVAQKRATALDPLENSIDPLRTFGTGVRNRACYGAERSRMALLQLFLGRTAGRRLVRLAHVHGVL